MLKNKKKIILIANGNNELNTQIYFLNYIHKYILSDQTYKNYEIKYEINKKIKLQNNVSNSNIFIYTFGISKNVNNINYVLDDKIKFYDFVIKYNSKINKFNKIHLIPTFNNSIETNIKDKYIIKHKNSRGSKDIIIKEDYIRNILNEYPPDTYQIQKFINYNYIYGINCSCVEGKVIGIYTYINNKVLRKIDYIFGFDHLVKNYIEFIYAKKFVYKQIQIIKYTGFIEFEFLVTNNKIYIMECNPRISGAINDPLYYKFVIRPYLDYLTGNKNIIANNKKISLASHFNNMIYRIVKLYVELFILLIFNSKITNLIIGYD